MRLKASYSQRVLMLVFMIAVCLWAAWPDRRLIVLVVLGGIRGRRHRQFRCAQPVVRMTIRRQRHDLPWRRFVRDREVSQQNQWEVLARPERFERPTLRFVV